MTKTISSIVIEVSAIFVAAQKVFADEYGCTETSLQKLTEYNLAYTSRWPLKNLFLVDGGH